MDIWRSLFGAIRTGVLPVAIDKLVVPTGVVDGICTISGTEGKIKIKQSSKRAEEDDEDENDGVLFGHF